MQLQSAASRRKSAKANDIKHNEEISMSFVIILHVNLCGHAEDVFICVENRADDV